MAPRQKRWTWPADRRDIVAAGSFLLFAVGLVVVGFGLANEDLLFTALGLGALVLPIVRWFRISRDAQGAWTFEGEMEKPPDAVNEQESGDEQSRRHSG